jgi:hypothetical protein
MMTRPRTAIALLAVAVMLALSPIVALLLLGTAVLGDSDRAPSQASCTGTVAARGAPRQLDDPAQVRNAQAIITEGLRLGVPRRGLEVAIATAMQESTLRADLDESESDRDSAGLFQQRRAWGPLAQRMNPTLSARRFFTGGDAGQPGLLDIKDWQGMSLTLAAQSVQRSAFPLAYAKWEPLAIAVVRDSTGGRAQVAQCTPLPGGPADCSAITAPVSMASTVAVRGIRVHPCAAPALDRMLAQAARDGVPLSGWGWRDMAKQAQLRIKNGCPDVYESPYYECRIWTAIPGTSKHEYGSAVDLTADGVTVQYGTTAHSWLAQNADDYGFFPIDTEAWHWQAVPPTKGSKK